MNISYDVKESCAKIDTELLNKIEEQRFDFVINEMIDRGWNFRFSIMWYSDRANARCPVNDYTEYQLLIGDFREIVETSYMIYRKEESLKELLFMRCLKEYENYLSKPEADWSIDDADTIGLKDIEHDKAHERFYAVYRIIEAAELEDEYEEWERTQ